MTCHSNTCVCMCSVHFTVKNYLETLIIGKTQFTNIIENTGSSAETTAMAITPSTVQTQKTKYIYICCLKFVYWKWWQRMIIEWFLFSWNQLQPNGRSNLSEWRRCGHVLLFHFHQRQCYRAQPGTTRHNGEDRQNILIFGGIHYEQMKSGWESIMANHTSNSHPL